MSFITPIKAVLATAPGTVVAAVRGSLKGVGRRNDGTKDTTAGPRAWSAQDLLLAGSDGSELLVTLWNKDAVAPEMVGRHVYLLSAVVKGRTVGLKTDTQDGKICLRVSAAAEMTFMEPGCVIPQPEAKPITGSGVQQEGASPVATVARPASVVPSSGILCASPSPAPLPAPGTAKAPPPPAKAPIGVPAGAAGAFGDRTAQIVDLVHLYDMCLSAAVAGVGRNMSDESGFLMSPEGAHCVAKAVFDQILK